MKGALNMFSVVSGHAVPRVFTEEGRNCREGAGGIVMLNRGINRFPAPAESQFCPDIALACTAQFMDRNRFRKTLWADPVDATKDEAVLCASLDGRAREHPGAVILVQALEPGGKIDGCTQRRVVHALRRTDVADDGVANVKAEASRRAAISRF